MVDQLHPHSRGTELVDVFLPLGLNQVQGLILGLVFSSRWLRIVCDTCHVNYLDTCHRLILIPLPHDAILLYGRMALHHD